MLDKVRKQIQRQLQPIMMYHLQNNFDTHKEQEEIMKMMIHFINLTRLIVILLTRNTHQTFLKVKWVKHKGLQMQVSKYLQRKLSKPENSEGSYFSKVSK